MPDRAEKKKNILSWIVTKLEEEVNKFGNRVRGITLSSDTTKKCLLKLLRVTINKLGEDFYSCIITVQETLLPYYYPETNPQSMQWCNKFEELKKPLLGGNFGTLSLNVLYLQPKVDVSVDPILSDDHEFVLFRFNEIPALKEAPELEMLLQEPHTSLICTLKDNIIVIIAPQVQRNFVLVLTDNSYIKMVFNSARLHALVKHNLAPNFKVNVKKELYLPNNPDSLGVFRISLNVKHDPRKFANPLTVTSLQKLLKLKDFSTLNQTIAYIKEIQHNSE
uniref:Uncharacterized protein n=1 Tax=Romanomermis culicivorax TaxID=13658 RepID=A0A915J285_ROMCU